MDVQNVTKVIIEDFPTVPQRDMHACQLTILEDECIFIGELKRRAMTIDSRRWSLSTVE
jgi:hypothetical protein